jgi:hypothetical protein
VPAAALERVVADRLIRLLSDGPELLGVMRSVGILPTEGAQQRSMLAAAQNLARRWQHQGNTVQREMLLALHTQICEFHAMVGSDSTASWAAIPRDDGH